MQPLYADLLPDQLFFKDTSLCCTEVNESFVVHHKLESSDAIVGLYDRTLLTEACAQRTETKRAADIHQANYDHLTQVLNRRLVAERRHSCWQFMRR